MSDFRSRFSLPQGSAVLYIVCITTLFFLLQGIIPMLTRLSLTDLLSMRPSDVIGKGRWWQIGTYMLMHGGFSHLLFNMLGLFFFGTQVERIIGTKEFSWFYLFCGVAAGATSLLWYLLSGNVAVTLLGASGAVYGVLLAFATYYPTARIFVFGIFPVSAPVLIVAYTLIALLSGLSGRSSGIAHFTHLAGFIYAYVYLRFRLKIDPIRNLFYRR